MQGSLQAAFEAAEDHKAEYFELRDMVLADHELDVEALAPAFKEKDANGPPAGQQAGPDDAAAAAANGGASEEKPEGVDGGADAGAQQAAASTRVTLDTFTKLMDMLADQKRRMEALPPYADVSIIRVDCGKLKEALLPAPTTSLAQLHAMLPQLAADLFQGFMNEVQVGACMAAGDLGGTLCEL